MFAFHQTRWAHLRQWHSVIRRVDFWVEEELRPQEALIGDIAAEVLPGLWVVSCVGFDVLAGLLIMLAELLQILVSTVSCSYLQACKTILCI